MSFQKNPGFILLLFVFISLSARAQAPDSLMKKLFSAKSETTTLDALNSITDHYIGENNDSAAYYNERSLDFSIREKAEKKNFDGYFHKARLKKIQKQYLEASEALSHASSIAKENNNKLNLAKALILEGSLLDAQNAGKHAIEKYLQALEISKSIKNKNTEISAVLALGSYFKKHNETTNALKYFLDAYKLTTEIRDSTQMFTCCINLGTLYELTNDKEKALKFYRTALLINERDNDENGTAICSFKIGRLYYQMNKNDSAKIFLTETLNIHLKRNDEVGLIFDYSFIAATYNQEGNYEKAEENWQKSLALAVKHNDSLRINLVYSYMGKAHQERKNYQKAFDLYKLSLQYAKAGIPKETLSMIYKHLAQLSADMGKYKDAYEYHILFKTWADSSYNASETKKQTELKLNYEFNQVQEKLLAESETKELKNKAEIEKQHLQRNFLLVGLGLISLLLIVAFRSFKSKQKANTVLEKKNSEIRHQKKLVDEKNREISDSINYAHRIQTASLPEKRELTSYFPEYSLFFKPKDIVSGDFYWAAGDENTALIAVGDCTGHGVPGAITSMIGSMLLNEIYYVKKIIQPDEVLKELNRLVKLTLRQEEHTLSKDGMDIALCLWDKQHNSFFYSGANRPLYVVRANEVIEYKATKVSVGGYVPLIQDYTLNLIPIEPGDTIVLTTDGYADQFGGKKEKKFTSKAFRELLKEIADQKISRQTNILEQRFMDWQDGFDQTDDVLVFMLKV